MSAVVSIETPTAVFFHHHGWGGIQRVQRPDRCQTQSYHIRKVPVAVATRGSMEVGAYFAEKFILAAERLGFDDAVAWMNGAP
jgi:hypothetical protein